MGPMSFLPCVSMVTVLCLLLDASQGSRSEVQGKVGGVVELECGQPPPDGSPYTPLHVVEWVRQGVDTPILIKFGVYGPRVNPVYEGRVSLVRSLALRVKGLAVEDQGWYQCRILLLDQPSDELHNDTWTLLTVTAPPTFAKTPPPAVEALLGSPLTLDCVADGNPPPTITWTKDGGDLQRGDGEFQSGSLSLRAVTREMAGRYSCHAFNMDGNLTHTTTVTVKGPPVIVIPPEDAVLNMSHNALLRCQAVSDPPNMTYVWQKGPENVHHIESLKSRVKIMVDGTLLITSLLPEDSGNYTCTATNGLLTPPTASATLTVQHPAQALPLPRETFLPTGMSGLLACPVRSSPPLLRVHWIKDGHPLDLRPGWTLTPEGSVSMVTVNDDVTGAYACTPYNSYGTMGQSETTTVVLQDPPSLLLRPLQDYREEVGGAVTIPCQATGGADTSLTWRKVGSAPRSPFSVAANGSLLLLPLSKDHQGAWECSAANRVAAVNATTFISVLGTTPHAPSSVAVVPGVTEADVSWHAGFDGGHDQTFSVWVKCMAEVGPQDWFSVPVPPSSGSSLQVTGLAPSSLYQFSVLAQNNIGTGPFSDICTARTLDPVPKITSLQPPSWLSANQSSAGVVLSWSLPEEPFPPISAFILQSRSEQGEWSDLDDNIDANRSEVVVQGLRKDCVYELRLLSRRGEFLSEPSPSVMFSTVGMNMYPDSSRLLEFVPEPLLAGVMGGLGFLCLVVLLLLATACVLNRRRARRLRKSQGDETDVLPAIFDCSPTLRRSSGNSPDSVLKRTLLSPHPLYPGSTTSSTTSYSSQASQSPYQDQHQQLLSSTPPPPSSYTQHRSYLPWANPPLTPSPLELISRGPDGRFIVQTSTLNSQTLRKDFTQSSGVQRSTSCRSERSDRKDPPFVLSVDLPPCGPDPGPSSPGGRVRSMAKQLSLHGRFYLEEELAVGEGFPDHSSLNSSRTSMTEEAPGLEEGEAGLGYPSLKREGQPPSSASTLVLQMEHERETGNLSKCLQLAREREELERELRKYTLERTTGVEGRRDKPRMEGGEGRREQLNRERDESGDLDAELVWKPNHKIPPQYHLQTSRGGSSSTAGRTSSLSYVHWETSPLISHTSQVPALPICSPLKISPGNGSVKQSRLTSPATGRHSDGSSIPLHTKPPLQRKVPEQCSLLGLDDNLTPDQKLPTNNSVSPSPMHNAKRYFPEVEPRTMNPEDGLFPADRGRCVRLEQTACTEMSVDSPEEDGMTCSPTTPMMHQRIASQLSSSLQPPSLSSSLQPPRSALRKALSLGSPSWACSQSLDCRGQKPTGFLTPDAWIDSLSQENFSTPFSFRPSSLSLSQAPQIQSSPSLETPRPLPPPPSSSPPPAPMPLSRAPSRHPSPSSAPPAMPSSSSQDPRRQASIFPDASRWPITYQEALRSVQRMEAMKQSPGNSLPHRSKVAMLREAPGPLGPRGRPGLVTLHRGYSWPAPQHHNPPDPASEGTEEGEEEREEEEGWVSTRHHNPHGPALKRKTEEKGKEEGEEESWPSTQHRPPQPAPEREEERCGDAEVRGYGCEGNSGGSYSSYASSGRGSMEPASGRLSLCLSPTLASSPETVEETAAESSQKDLTERDPPNRDHSEAVKGRKASVDENYEWDSTEVSSPSTDLRVKGLFSSVNLVSSAPRCFLPSMPGPLALRAASALSPAERRCEEPEPVLF